MDQTLEIEKMMTDFIYVDVYSYIIQRVHEYIYIENMYIQYVCIFTYVSRHKGRLEKVHPNKCETLEHFLTTGRPSLRTFPF